MSLTKVTQQVLEEFENLEVTVKLTVSGTEESTATNTGSLVVSGGVGVAKNVTATKFFVSGVSTPTTSYDGAFNKLHAGNGINVLSGSSLTFGDGGTYASITGQSGVSSSLTGLISTNTQVFHATSVGMIIGAGTGPAATLDVRGDGIINGNLRVDSLGVGTDASLTPGEIRAANEITAYYGSDKRLKTNIVKIDNALNKVKQLNGVMFDWTDDCISSRGGEDGYFVRKHDTGLIADEVEAVMPEVVAERPDGFKGVKYEKLQGLVIEAIKQLEEEVSSIKKHLGIS